MYALYKKNKLFMAFVGLFFSILMIGIIDDLHKGALSKTYEAYSNATTDQSSRKEALKNASDEFFSATSKKKCTSWGKINCWHDYRKDLEHCTQTAPDCQISYINSYAILIIMIFVIIIALISMTVIVSQVALAVIRQR